MKRDRGDHVDRDGAEVQQRRLVARHPRTGNWRGGNRKEGEYGDNYQDLSFLSMEFDIQRDMVGAVIGKGGGTARSIRSRTGAIVHVHSPANETERTYVELRGRREQVRARTLRRENLLAQIESAFEELRTVVASVDDEYAQHMHAKVTLRTRPESVGCLIGKQGQNIKQIEEETRARVRVEPHEEGEEFQCVHVSGDVHAVEMATQMVQESLERYDATRSKKVTFNTHVPRVPPPPPPKPIETPPHQQPQPQPEVPSQPELEPAAPPIYIQAPTGGFGPHPAILVLQADGTYHPAQIVAAVDGNLNAASIMAISPPPVPSILPQSQPDGNTQRMPQTAFPQPMSSFMTQLPMSVTSQPIGNMQQPTQQLYSVPGVATAEMPQSIGFSVVDPAAQSSVTIPYTLNSMTPVQPYDYPSRGYP